MKRAISILFFISIFAVGFSQTTQKYWVFFNDKCSADFNPYDFFDQKAIERRIKNNIPLNHYTDYPVCVDYILSIKNIADSISHASRWFNALAFYGDEEQVNLINQLNFVDSITLISTLNHNSNLAEIETISDDSKSNKEQLLSAQTEILGGSFFKANKINGNGIRIAILDAGFPGAESSEIFNHVRVNNKIIATYDFVKNSEKVYKYSHHGTNVFSCIAGVYNNQPIGLATDAEFLLARTENASTEPFSEEENWLAAAEWADKNGAHIINSSLAYTKRRYFTEEMDGRTSLVSKAATMAAQKGILVINAAGNDGDTRWKFIGTPGDADSVLTVGGINPYTNYHISFSSFGPTADNRMKPNVSTFGKCVVGGLNEIHVTQGTSFSSPLIAGYAACVWQLHPDLTNMDIYDLIQKSAYLYPYYDYAHGYGIPNAAYFFEENIAPLPTISFDITQKHIIFRVKDGEYVKNPKLEYLYYHIENTDGILEKYGVINIETQSPYQIQKSSLNPGDVLRVFYKGYIASYKM